MLYHHFLYFAVAAEPVGAENTHACHPISSARARRSRIKKRTLGIGIGIKRASNFAIGARAVGWVMIVGGCVFKAVEQFALAGPDLEVKAELLENLLGGLVAGPQDDQQTIDQGHTDLNGDIICGGSRADVDSREFT